MVMLPMSMFLLLVLGYVAGSLPTGKMVGRWHGVDIQKRGSGNIGFANVRRILGWRAGIITLAVDIAKALVPTLLALRLLGPQAAFWVGYASVLGHIFPIWLRLRGGKGVASGLGVVAVLYPLAAAIGGILYVAGCSRRLKSSTSSLIGVGAVVLIIILVHPENWWQAGLLLITALCTLQRNILGNVRNYELETADS